MSLKIGGSKSNSSSSSTTQTNSTTTPIVPQWASDLTQNVAGRVGGLLNTDPQSLIAALRLAARLSAKSPALALPA